MNKLFKKNKMICLIKNDFSLGIIEKWYKYAGIVIIAVIFCMSLYAAVSHFNVINKSGNVPSFMDYILYMFSGMEIYKPRPGKPFDIPVIWLTPNLYLAFIITSYSIRDLSGFGKHLLMQTRNRVKWYLSKCIWIFNSVLVFYISIYFVMLSVSAITRNMSLEISRSVMSDVLKNNLSGVNTRDLLISAIFLPFVTSLALSLLQLLLEFMLKPIYSYVVIVCILVSSAYFYTPYLSGNISMMLRSNLIINNGINFSAGLLVNAAIIVFAVPVGCLYFKKRDILDRS